MKNTKDFVGEPLGKGKKLINESSCMVGAQFSLILHSEDNNSRAWAIISVEWLAEQYKTQSNRRSFDYSDISANNRLASLIFCLHTCPAWKWEETKQIIKRNKDKEDNDTRRISSGRWYVRVYSLRFHFVLLSIGFCCTVMVLYRIDGSPLLEICGLERV